jgi:DnaJ-class molecular chaperone
MPPASIDHLEITALAKIMDELDYYQLLNIEKSASSSDIRKAFHMSSRAFHPDANRELESNLKSQCQQISKRITEAYCVLRDTRRRKAYDARISDGTSLRIQIAEARQAHDEQRKTDRTGVTAQGRQFFGKAEAALKAGNLDAAIQNIQMAQTFEPNNVAFKAMIDELRAQKKARK